MLNKTLLTALTATATLFAASTTSATSINMDFFWGTTNYDGGNGFGTMSGAAAVGSAGDVWNPLGVTNTTVNDLLDTSGAAVIGSSFTIDGTAGVSDNQGPGWDLLDPLSALMRDYFITSPGNTSNATITVPDTEADYTLYLYGITNYAPQNTDFTVAGANEPSPQQPTSPDLVGPLTLGEDYVVFTGKTSATGTIDISFTGNPDWSGWNGFQLVVDSGPIPEPSSLALLGLGGLIAARRRRG